MSERASPDTRWPGGYVMAGEANLSKGDRCVGCEANLSPREANSQGVGRGIHLDEGVGGTPPDDAAGRSPRSTRGPP
eukprot:8873597-Pyramimonas_sp.AAC.1